LTAAIVEINIDNTNYQKTAIENYLCPLNPNVMKDLTYNVYVHADKS